MTHITSPIPRLRSLFPLIAMIMLIALVSTPRVTAEPDPAGPSLSQPIDCTIGETCFIQHFVDRDPSPESRDFRCGALSYDGHKGTDFALLSTAAMTQGVDVLAAASGRVVRSRDGIEDRHYTEADEARVDGRDCGNGVVIDHGAGWETQYCHLRRGSLRVAPGDVVDAGTPIGQVGLSGRTQFPHLHMSLRYNGQVVDPFAPTPAIETATDKDTAHCARAVTSLWVDPPPYRATGIITVGFAPHLPKYAAIKAGTAHHPDIAYDAAALVLWGYFYGGQPGDEIKLTIDGPRGTFFETKVVQDKPKITYIRAAGRKLRRGVIPGTYHGTITLTRQGVEIASKRVLTKLE